MKSWKGNLRRQPTLWKTVVLWALTSTLSGYLFLAGLLHALDSSRLRLAGLRGNEILIGLFLAVLVAALGIAHPFQRWSGMRGVWLVGLRVLDWALILFLLIYVVRSGALKALLPTVALLALAILTHLKIPSPYSERDFEKHSAELVVFVHGFRGHYKRTWGRFPDLLKSDLDLPALGVLLWGYRTMGFPWDPSLQKVADRLETELRLGVPAHARLYLVGHSMGGLVILKSLVDAMKAGRANEPPATQVARITLFASPCNGSTAAALVTYLRPSRLFFGPQVRELARGSFTDSLLAEVVERLYRPSIRPGDENSKRAILLRANVAEDDRIVSETSARSIFANPAPFVLQGDHFTIKMPKDHRDLRYEALKKDIEDVLSVAFHELCSGCLSSDGVIGTERQLQFERLYGRCVAGKLRGARPNLRNDEFSKRHQEATELVWVLGAQKVRRPGEAVDTALAILPRRGI